MIALIENMSAQRGKEMRRDAASRRLTRMAGRSRPRPRRRKAADLARLAVRRLDPSGSDRAELERLAGRDSASPPSGEVVGAEQDGKLVAAVSLTTGELVADPFLPTAGARSVLLERAGTLPA